MKFQVYIIIGKVFEEPKAIVKTLKHKKTKELVEKEKGVPKIENEKSSKI